MQLVITIRSGQFTAMPYHIFLKIQPYDVYIKTLQFSEIIIHSKSKIGFSAAKIQDRDLSVLRKLRKDIPDKLQKAIDLSELVISGSNDLSILCHNSQIHQKRSCRSLSENVLFHPVMRSDLYLLILCRPVLFCFDGCFPFLADKDTSILTASGCLKLTKFLHGMLQISDHLFPGKILMINLRPFCHGRLVKNLTLQLHRTKLHLGRSLASPAATDNSLYQLFINLFF